MDNARLQADISQLRDTFLMRLGAMQQQIEDLQKQVAELKEAKPSGGSSGGRWETTGETAHTITHLARGKDSKGTLFLLLWSGTTNFSISYYWLGETNKDEILAQIETLSGKKFTSLPWINDVRVEKDVLKAQMLPCNHFGMHQTIKVKGEKTKYFIDKFYAFDALPATPPPTAPATATPKAEPKPQPAAFDLSRKLLEAWKKYGIPEEKAKLALKGAKDDTVADMVLAYLGQVIVIDGDLFDKGFIVPMSADQRNALYEYGKATYDLTETEVKIIFRWFGEAKLQSDVGGNTDIGKLQMWQFEYAIDIAQDELKKSRM